MNISKIANINMTGNYSIHKNKEEAKPVMQSASQTEQLDPKAANALKNITFGNNIENSEPTTGIEIGKVEKADKIVATLNGKTQIPDELNFKYGDFRIKSTRNGEVRDITISQKGKKIAKAAINDKLGNDAEVKFATAKHKPELSVVLEDGTEIKLLEGSKIKSKDNNINIQYFGNYNTPDGKKTIKDDTQSNTPSFTGNYVSVLCKKDSVVDAINNTKPTNFIAGGQFANEVREGDPSFVILGGGFGTRFANMTPEGVCKPAFVLPNDQSIIGATCDLVKNASASNELGRPVIFLEQNDDKNPATTDGLKDPHDLMCKMNAFSSDGGAVIDAINKGLIPKEKPLGIFNADTITNMDPSYTYHKLNELDNAAMVIPIYPVPESRAKSFGLMSVGESIDNEGARELLGFNEKPANPAEEAKDAMIEGKFINNEQAYNGNPGIYMFNKEVLQNIDLILPKAEEIALTKAQTKAIAENKEVPTELKDPFSDSTLLGNAFVPAIVELSNEGKLLNANGEPMKVYAVPMKTANGEQAYWDDIGSAEACVHTCQEIAYETIDKGNNASNKFFGIRGLEDFVDSVDKETGIVFANKDVRNDFEANHADKFDIAGDVYINKTV